MKLTKGKISKIQNKNKQSLKKYKTTGKTHKSKTFRKRRPVNLHISSLKKYRGGQDKSKSASPDAAATTNSDPTVDPTINLDAAPTTSSTTTTSSDPTVDPTINLDAAPATSSTTTTTSSSPTVDPTVNLDAAPSTSSTPTSSYPTAATAPIIGTATLSTQDPTSTSTAPMGTVLNTPDSTATLSTQDPTVTSTAPMGTVLNTPDSTATPAPIIGTATTPIIGTATLSTQDPTAPMGTVLNTPSTSSIPTGTVLGVTSSSSAPVGTVVPSSAPPLPMMGQGSMDPSMYQTQPGQYMGPSSSSAPIATPMDTISSSSPFGTQYPPSATASFPNSFQSMGQGTPDIVVESLDNLADYIANKIAQKMQSSSPLNTDSFNAVANAATTMAQSQN